MRLDAAGAVRRAGGRRRGVGAGAPSPVEEYRLLDTATVTLRVDLSFLDACVSDAWGLAPKHDRLPLCIRVTFSRTGYGPRAQRGGGVVAARAW
eukprot:gene7474-2835_t